MAYGSDAQRCCTTTDVSKQIENYKYVCTRFCFRPFATRRFVGRPLAHTFIYSTKIWDLSHICYFHIFRPLAVALRAIRRSYVKRQCNRRLKWTSFRGRGTEKNKQTNSAAYQNMKIIPFHFFLSFLWTDECSAMC